MRCDAISLCDRDFNLMRPGEYKFEHEFLDFKCRQDSCVRYYSEILGYLTPVPGKPIRTGDGLHCNEHDRPMFISEINYAGTKQTFSCPIEGCGFTLQTQVEGRRRG